MSSLDSLYERVARKVLTETLQVGKGSTLSIETWDNGVPFARTAVVEARRLGAAPLVLLEEEAAYLQHVRTTPRDQLGTMGKHEFNLLAASDAYLFIPGPLMNAYSPRMTRQDYIDSTRYNSSWYEAAEKARLRGARLTFGYVGKEFAKLLGKTPEEIMRHQLRAALEDFKGISEKGNNIAKNLQDGVRATIQTPGATLDFTLKGELSVEDGIVDENDLSEGYNVVYIPPGFVTKQVDGSSVNGTVSVSPSTSRLGIVQDATLEFRGGKLTGWKSKESKKILDELIQSVQPDKRLLSNITIGLNPSMKYEYGQDRFVSGSVGLQGFGYTAIARKATLTAGGDTLVDGGKLAA